MSTPHLRIVFAALSLGALVSPRVATSQDRVDPAPAVRVVESRDPATGQVARWVIESPTPAEILRIQVELARAGFEPRVRTGVLDAPTRSALSSFQTVRGIVICGCLTYETIIALGIRPDVVDFVQADATGATAYADDIRTYDATYDRFSQVILVVPFDDFFRKRRHRFPRSGVIVGHEPAVGAGQIGVPVTVGVREIIPPPPAPRIRPGARIRPGSGSRMTDPRSRPARPTP